MGEVWELSITSELEPLHNGNWTPLEVYVALLHARMHAQITLNEMAIQYTGYLPPMGSNSIARRPSYAQVRASAGGLSRTRSSADTDALPAAKSLRHRHADVTMSLPDSQHRFHRTASIQETSSLSQVGLEAVDEVEAVLRQDSVRSDTVDRAQRLSDLMKGTSPSIAVKPDIKPQEPRVHTATLPDRTHAHDLLVTIRRDSPGFKDPTMGVGKLLKSKESKQRAQDTHNWVFSNGEKSHALKRAVEYGYVGVAEVLLDMGADVNAVREEAKSRILRTKSVIARPVNYLQVAAATNNVEMVNLLASRGVSSRSLAEALDKAVRQGLPDVVLALLQHEADPNALAGVIFQSAIQSQRPEIVELLLRARVKVAEAYLAANLPLAVSQGQPEIVSLLIAYGADVNHDNASALRKAVQNERIDLVLAFMKGKPSRESVSVAFEDAFSANSSMKLSEQYLLIEILLCAGAQGECVAETLVQVVRSGNRDMAKLLILHGASPLHKSAEALKIAVAARDVDLVKIVLVDSVTKSWASRLFKEIPRPYTEPQTYNLMSALIFKGASGTSLDEALVVAVQQQSGVITKLLLDHKASADYNDAQALQIAASAGNLSTVDLLLSKGQPRPHSMQYVLPLVPAGPQNLRYSMTKSIIDAASFVKIPTPLLDAALMKIIDPQCNEIDLPLANILIVAGADVNHSNGIYFKEATRRGALELLELLVTSSANRSSISSAVLEVSKLPQSSLKRRITTLLLDHGARGPAVSRALIDSLEGKFVDEDMVMALLAQADVNYRGGQALVLAMRLRTKLISSMIDIGRPDQQTLNAALSIALDPSTKDRQTKLDLLLKAGIDQKGLDDALVREISNGPSHSITLVESLLHHHASCNHDAGKAMELAIKSGNVTLLELLVDSKPNHQTLASMLSIAMREAERSLRYKFLVILLQGGARGNNVSDALAQEVCSDQACELQLARLLVQHNAMIDYSDGLAIKRAVSVPLETELLRILVEGRGASTVLPCLIPLAMVHTQEIRLPLLQIILEKGPKGQQIDAALIDAVLEGPASQPTIGILLQYGASLDFDNAKALKEASAAGYPSIVRSLLSTNPTRKHLSEALRSAMRVPVNKKKLDSAMRLSCVKLITDSGVQKCEAVHQVLIQAVQEADHDLIKYLIESGADPNYENGISVVTATEQADIKSLTLLAKANPLPEVYSNAFAVTASQGLERRRLEPELHFSIDKLLISGGASGPAVDQAFFNALRSKHALAAEFVNMIIKSPSPLDVNFEGGKSLCLAAKENRFNLVKELLNRAPSVETLCTAFISSLEAKTGELPLMNMIKLFLESSKGKKYIYFAHHDASRNPFYQVLHHHADKPELLQYLLDNGCPTDTPFEWQFHPEQGREEVSGLLWLLCQADDRTDRRTVKMLLDHGGEFSDVQTNQLGKLQLKLVSIIADPNFRTSRSYNSPLIIAASSSQPALVLLLLEAGARAATEDRLRRTPLYYAARVGCLESMKHLLNYNVELEDESLHIAARFTHAEAVNLLLDHGASVDYPGVISCEDRTPMGEICRRTDPEKDPARLKETLRELAKRKPNPQKLANGKSLVFLALDNNKAIIMVRILLAVWPYLREHLNSDFNIYRKEGGFCYSPTMYVRHFKCLLPPHRRDFDREHQCCQLHGCLAPALEKLLRAYECQDRFWNDRGGAEQPRAACGEPSHIIKAQEEAERLRRRQQEQARLKAEEQARRAAEQAALDAEAAAEQQRLDAAAAAERQRERDRLAIIERKREADAREEQRQLQVAEEKRRAEAREERRRLTAIEEEARAERDRNKRAFEEKLAQTRSMADEEARRKRRQDEQTLATLKEQARLEKEVIKERKKLLDGAVELVRQTQIAGFGQQSAGRILGEIEAGGQLRLT